jgi:hypothetical protein
MVDEPTIDPSPKSEEAPAYRTLFGRRVPASMTYERVHMYTQYFTFLVIIFTAPLGLLGYYRHNMEVRTQYIEQRNAIAQEAYRDVDIKYREFVRLCLDHPRLDCYSVSAGLPDPPLTKDEKLQQKILYTVLTDVLEDAYLKYQTNLHELDPLLDKIFHEQ